MLLFLVYHKISGTQRRDVFTVDPAAFLAHLRMVKESGVPIVDPRTLKAEGSGDSEGVVLTFDDGTADHFQAARPILENFSARAIFYVSTERIGRSEYLTADQIQTLHEDGHTIGSHSHCHRPLHQLTRELVAHELGASATILCDVTGERPIHFSPPGGLYSRIVVEEARREGYQFFRTMNWGYNRRLKPMAIAVVPMTNGTGMRFLESALRGEGEWSLKLLYYVKNAIRGSFPGYGAFRSTAMQLLDR